MLTRGADEDAARELLEQMRWGNNGAVCPHRGGAEPYKLTPKPEPMASKLRGVVEVDETYVGGRRRLVPQACRRDGGVERGGRVRAFPMERVTSANAQTAIRQMVENGTTVMTDELNI